MYGIIDYETKWVICRCHQHRSKENHYEVDCEQFAYVIGRKENYIAKTDWYAGTDVYKGNMLIISEEQYTFLTAECEKIMKAKSLLTTTIGALVSNLPKPKIDEEITDVEFKKVNYDK